MGVVLSTNTEMSSIGFASTVIGFVGFAFTLATLIRVFWDSLMTIKSAPTQIQDFLANLGQGLQEERRHLRRVRQRLRRERARSRRRKDDLSEIGEQPWGRRPGSRSGRKRRRSGSQPRSAAARGRFIGEDDYGSAGEERYDNFDGFDYAHSDIAMKTLRDSLRHMIASFRQLEAPFLAFPDGGTLGPDPSIGITGGAAVTRDEKQPRGYYSGEIEEARDERTIDRYYYRTEYKACGFKERWIWLQTKTDVLALMESLSRIETRRSAMELGWVAGMMRDMEWEMREFEDRMGTLEQKLSNVVGVRQVN